MYVLLWLALTLFCIAVQGLYSMVEMAAVSFNRVRLEYYVSKKVKRALWLQTLLQKPSRLFGTIMLGVNIALQIGSQSSREFYRSLNLDPDFAPLTQVFIVVIFAEIAPLFAARYFSEHVIMLAIPIVYATYRFFSPFIWLIGKMTHLIYKILGKKGEEFKLYMSREELQNVLESHEEEDEFNIIVSNIFALRAKTAASVMVPLAKIEMIPANITVESLRKKISAAPQPFVPLYHKAKSNIIAIAIAKDLVRLSDNRYVRDHARPPWFITASTTLMQILEQFRRNRQSAAVVLDGNGNAIGMLTLDAIMEEIFGEHPLPSKSKKPPTALFVERTFAGNTKIADFNREYGAHLSHQGVETLAQLMMIHLNHYPEEGDSCIVDNFELTAEETTLRGIKSLTVRSIENFSSL